jgi:hypothetical protein
MRIAVVVGIGALVLLSCTSQRPPPAVAPPDAVPQAVTSVPGKPLNMALPIEPAALGSLA